MVRTWKRRPRALRTPPLATWQLALLLGTVAASATLAAGASDPIDATTIEELDVAYDAPEDAGGSWSLSFAVPPQRAAALVVESAGASFALTPLAPDAFGHVAIAGTLPAGMTPAQLARNGVALRIALADTLTGQCWLSQPLGSSAPATPPATAGSTVGAAAPTAGSVSTSGSGNPGTQNSAGQNAAATAPPATSSNSAPAKAAAPLSNVTLRFNAHPLYISHDQPTPVLGSGH